MIKEKNVRTTTNVKLREKPKIKALAYNCFLEFKNTKDTFSFLPANYELRIFARTLEKEKIKEKTDYWYYAEPLLDWYSGCSNNDPHINRAWIFGAYIQ